MIKVMKRFVESFTVRLIVNLKVTSCICSDRHENEGFLYDVEMRYTYF